MFSGNVTVKASFLISLHGHSFPIVICYKKRCTSIFTVFVGGVVIVLTILCIDSQKPWIHYFQHLHKTFILINFVVPNLYSIKVDLWGNKDLNLHSWLHQNKTTMICVKKFPGIKIEKP